VILAGHPGLEERIRDGGRYREALSFALVEFVPTMKDGREAAG
jgi:hypothetical protein